MQLRNTQTLPARAEIERLQTAALASRAQSIADMRSVLRGGGGGGGGGDASEEVPYEQLRAALEERAAEAEVCFTPAHTQPPYQLCMPLPWSKRRQPPLLVCDASQLLMINLQGQCIEAPSNTTPPPTHAHTRTQQALRGRLEEQARAAAQQLRGRDAEIERLTKALAAAKPEDAPGRAAAARMASDLRAKDGRLRQLRGAIKALEAKLAELLQDKADR